MANFCLPRDRVEKFVAGLKSGELDPEKLSNMTSAERRTALAEHVGEEAAKKVNAEFESKLLLKNQNQGIATWIKNVAGLKPQARRDLLSRVAKLDKVLDPQDKEQFLSDLAAHKIGADVTPEEAKSIADLSKEVQSSQEKMDPKTFSFPSESDRLAYGRSVVEFEDYVSGLKNTTNKLTLQDFKRSPTGATIKSVSNATGLMKSLKASLDNSVIGNQGIKILFTHPSVWLRNSRKSFVDMAQTFGGKEVLNEVRADIASRPNALNGIYRKEKLALGNAEEAYPTSLPEKIPIAGRAFKASEAAFVAFQYRTRADIMDQFVKLADKTGGDIKGMGMLANSLTGRGNLHKLEPIADTVNNVFFSPRFVKSNIDTLTGHILDYKNLSPLARKEAAKNTVKIIAGIGSILAIAKAVAPGSVDFDPRSTDFGKIKIGDTRFNVSGGMAGLVTLVAKELEQSSKSATTGNISKFNSGIGSSNGMSVIGDFLMGKASPAASLVKDLLNRKDFNGDPITLQGELSQSLAPLPYTNYTELKADPKAANTILAMLSDALGIQTNTPNVPSWKNTTSKTLLQFREKVGDDKFQAANTDFNNQYADRLKKLRDSSNFQALSEDDRSKALTTLKKTVQSDVLKSNGFEYVKDAPVKKVDFKDMVKQ